MLLRRSTRQDLRRFRRLRRELIACGWPAPLAEARAREAVLAARSMLRVEWNIILADRPGFDRIGADTPRNIVWRRMLPAYRAAARVLSAKYHVEV